MEKQIGGKENEAALMKTDLGKWIKLSCLQLFNLMRAQ